jgi:alkylhydroperoxidase/carboxymuconolactone decarboxylase family protein YurZ
MARTTRDHHAGKESEMADQATDQGTADLIGDLLSEMTAASVERSSLDPQTLMLVRVAALVAMDAPPLSYLRNLAVAGAVGLTAADVQGVLTAVAPIVGTTRIVASASKIARAVGIADLLDEDAELARGAPTA